MNLSAERPALFLCVLLAASVAKAQGDSHNNVLVRLEVLDIENGLPGAGSSSTAPVGARFGKEKTRESDNSGKVSYRRTIDGQSRWLPDNAIEITLDINENGRKRTKTIRLIHFEPKILVLRENRGLGKREVLRLIPVFEPANATLGRGTS